MVYRSREETLEKLLSPILLVGGIEYRKRYCHERLEQLDLVAPFLSPEEQRQARILRNKLSETLAALHD